MAKLKLLRNTTMFPTRAAALSDIAERAATLADGEMWVASYGQNPTAKSILAIKRNYGVTVFDNDATSSDISQQIQDAIDNLAAIAKTGSADDAIATPIEGSSTTVAVQGDKVSEQIGSLATTLKTVQDNASKYKMLALTQSEIEQLSDENIKEAYKVVSFEGEETPQTVYTQVGDIVKIYKDSSLKEAYLGTDSDTVDTATGAVTKYIYQLIADPTTKITQEQYDALSPEDKNLYEAIDSQCLNYIYQLVDGTYQIVRVDVSKFLSESEFGNGLNVDNTGVVSVKIDTDSADAENFITVGDDGIKISGINDAINEAVNDSISGTLDDLDATVKSSLDPTDDTKVAQGKHVGVKIVQTDGVLASVDVVEDDIASAAIVSEIEKVTSHALNDLNLTKADKEDILTEIQGGDGINITVKAQNKQTISLKIDNETEDNILQLTADGLYAPSAFDCGSY